MIVAETPRLILRQLTLDDVDDLAKLYADSGVRKFYVTTLTSEETKQRVERIISSYEQRGWSLWATIHKADNKFIGRCGLIPQLVDRQQEVEIAYILAKEYWGAGSSNRSSLCYPRLRFREDWMQPSHFSNFCSHDELSSG